MRLGGQAGAEFPNPSTSELVRDSENASLIRSANAKRTSEEQSDSKALDSRPSTLDPRLSTLYARLSEGSAFGLGLCAEGCFVRGEAGGGAGDHRAEWGGQINFAQDSFAGYDAEFGADQGAGADCFVAGGRHGVPSGIDGSGTGGLGSP